MQVNRTGYIVIGVVALLVICSSRHTASDAETKSKLAQVDSLAAAGSFEDAATLIESIDERLFPDTVILLRKGIIYRQLDDVESRRKSVHFFRRLVDRYPTNPRFFLELARTLLAQAFDYEAESQLRRAIELNPTDEIPYLLLYDIYAPSYFFNGWETEANQAESTLQAFLRQVPSSRNGLCKLASLEAVRGRLSLALEHTQRVLVIDSAAVDVNLIMAYIQYRMRNYELCQHYFDKALAGMTHFQRWAYTTVECVLPPQVAGALAQRLTRKDLTERETAVLKLLVLGRSNKEIATELAISERTVSFHLAGIFEKLKVLDRSQAIIEAIRHGIVQMG